MATFGPLPGPRKSGPRPLFTAWTRGPRSHERIIRIIRIIRFIKIIGLICIIRIISTISQYLISSGPARRLLRAPGRQGPKNGHFAKGLQKEVATFGPPPRPRKSGPRPLFTAWTELLDSSRSSSLSGVGSAAPCHEGYRSLQNPHLCGFWSLFAQKGRLHFRRILRRDHM